MDKKTIKDFKVGDKVISKAGCSWWHSGEKGHVVAFTAGMMEVCFPGLSGGHQGSSHGGSDRWYFYDGSDGIGDVGLLTVLENKATYAVQGSGDGYRVVKTETVSREETTWIARCDLYEHAAEIVKALNS